MSKPIKNTSQDLLTARKSEDDKATNLLLKPLQLKMKKNRAEITVNESHSSQSRDKRNVVKETKSEGRSGQNSSEVITNTPCLGELCHNLKSTKIKYVYHALLAIKQKHLGTAGDITDFRRRDGIRRVVEILARKEASNMELAVSVLGQCCTDEKCRLLVLELDGVTVLCDLLVVASTEKLRHRICRALIVLVQNGICCEIVHDHAEGDVIRTIVDFLSDAVDREWKLTLCKLITLLSNTFEHRATIVTAGGVRVVAMLLATPEDSSTPEDPKLIHCALLAVCRFISDCTEECAAHLAAAKTFHSLVSLASRRPVDILSKTASEQLIKIARIDVLSAYLGNSGGVAYFIQQIEDCLEQPTTSGSKLKYALPFVDALCYCVRWPANKNEFIALGKMSLFTALLRSNEMSSWHRAVVRALGFLCVKGKEIKNESSHFWHLRNDASSAEAIKGRSNIEILFNIGGTMRLLIDHLYSCTGAKRTVENAHLADSFLRSKKTKRSVENRKKMLDELFGDERDSSDDSKPGSPSLNVPNIDRVESADVVGYASPNWVTKDVEDNEQLVDEESGINTIMDFTSKDPPFEKQLSCQTVAEEDRQSTRYSMHSPTYQAISTTRQVDPSEIEDYCRGPLNMWEGVSMFSDHLDSPIWQFPRSPSPTQSWSGSSLSPSHSSISSPRSTHSSPVRDAPHSPIAERFDLSPLSWKSPVYSGGWSSPNDGFDSACSPPYSTSEGSPSYCASSPVGNCSPIAGLSSSENREKFPRINSEGRSDAFSMSPDVTELSLGGSPCSESGFSASWPSFSIGQGTSLICEDDGSLLTTDDVAEQRHPGDWSPMLPDVTSANIIDQRWLRGAKRFKAESRSSYCDAITDYIPSPDDRGDEEKAENLQAIRSITDNRDLCTSAYSVHKPCTSEGVNTARAAQIETNSVELNEINLVDNSSVTEFDLSRRLNRRERARFTKTFDAFQSIAEQSGGQRVLNKEPMGESSGSAITWTDISVTGSPGSGDLLGKKRRRSSESQDRIKRIVSSSVKLNESTSCFNLKQLLVKKHYDLNVAKTNETPEEKKRRERYGSAEIVLRLFIELQYTLNDVSGYLMHYDVLQAFLDHVAFSETKGRYHRVQIIAGCIIWRITVNKLCTRAALILRFPGMISWTLSGSAVNDNDDDDDAYPPSPRKRYAGFEITGEEDEPSYERTLHLLLRGGIRALRDKLLSELAATISGPWGGATVDNILRRGNETEKRNCALSICYLVGYRDTRSIRVVMSQCLDVLIDVLRTHDTEDASVLLRSVIHALCQLGSGLKLRIMKSLDDFNKHFNKTNWNHRRYVNSTISDDVERLLNGLGVEYTKNKASKGDYICDVRLVLDNGTCIDASRTMLSDASSVFSAMFGGSFAESRATEVRVSEVPTRAFQLAVDWVHANHSSSTFHDKTVDTSYDKLLNVANPDDDDDFCFLDVVLEALVIAERYMLDDLKRALLCYLSSHLKSHIDIDNVCAMFGYCVRINDAKFLAHHCAAHIITKRNVASSLKMFEFLLRETKAEFIAVIEHIFRSALQ